jgi:hypothetical protein
VYVVSVRRLVPSVVNQSLVVAVLKRLDYGNDAQADLPSYLHRRLLSILVGRRPMHRSDLLTDTLASFHWLRSTVRIQFKLIVYRSLHGTAQRSQWRRLGPEVGGGDSPRRKIFYPSPPQNVKFGGRTVFFVTRS